MYRNLSNSQQHCLEPIWQSLPSKLWIRKSLKAAVAKDLFILLRGKISSVSHIVTVCRTFNTEIFSPNETVWCVDALDKPPRNRKISFYSLLTSQMRPTWDNHGCCSSRGLWVVFHDMLHRALGVLLRYSPRHRPLSALWCLHRTSDCMDPIHPRSICQNLKVNVPWQFKNQFSTHFGGHACVLHCTTDGSGRRAWLQSDSSTSAPVKRLRHIGNDIL